MYAAALCPDQSAGLAGGSQLPEIKSVNLRDSHFPWSGKLGKLTSAPPRRASANGSGRPKLRNGGAGRGSGPKRANGRGKLRKRNCVQS